MTKVSEKKMREKDKANMGMEMGDNEGLDQKCKQLTLIGEVNTLSFTVPRTCHLHGYVSLSCFIQKETLRSH